MREISNSMASPFTYLRISITDQCRLRCAYCWPVDSRLLPTHTVLPANDIRRVATAFAQLGVTKIRLTGGEPLLRRDVLPIISGIHDIPGIHTVGLTTNGLLLADMVDDLAQAGVRRLNISVDSLRARTYRQITGKDALPVVLRGIDAAVRRSHWQVSLNVVVMRGINDAEVPAFADLTRDLPLEVRFIELMPLQDSEFWQQYFVPSHQSRALLGTLEPVSADGAAAVRRYRLPHGGIIGFISPISEPFCAACTRLRLTADGWLLPCLRAANGVDLRPKITQPDFEEWLAQTCAHLHRLKVSPVTAHRHPVPVRAMCHIGG